ncbi:family 20 glycosylhydrolase [Streptomyces sp. NPDC059740]|uniref:family 20 glycosylhydrolase n=1 Tax=Streptomyces sp. NPDC059740 TaxID=3346926 RepID=UPI003660EC7F
MDSVLPRPRCHAAAPGGGRTRTAGRRWRLVALTPAAEPVARTLLALLAPHLGERLLPATATDDALLLTLGLHASGEGVDAPREPIGLDPHGGEKPVDETHQVVVDDSGVHCRAATPEGLFRAATTAAQLLLTRGEAPEGIGHQRLRDAPRVAWRGLLVDPARGYLTPDELRRLIDLMALYKLNVLHLHLTDNEGWRLQLEALPATGTSGDGRTGGREARYTATEYRELQAYAADRFVTLVPEINLPGHCAALRSALPHLPPAPAPGGLADRFPFVPPLDLADTATRETVAALLAEVCALTEGPFVHIGGDEAVGMTADSFHTAVRELRALARAAGKRPIGWQETSRAGVEPEDIAQFWVDVPMMELPETEEELRARPELLAAGHTMAVVGALRSFFGPTDHDLRRILDGGGRVLLSPQSHLYLDRRYDSAVVPAEQRADAARLGFPAYRPRGVRHVADWDPAAHAVPDDRLAGIEMTLFGETVTGLDDVATLLLPRLPVLADTAWNATPAPWPDTAGRLPHHAPLWRNLGLPHLASTEVAWGPEAGEGRVTG